MLRATEPIPNPAPDEDEHEPEASQAPVPSETLREAAVRISDDMGGNVIKGRKKCKG